MPNNTIKRVFAISAILTFLLTVSGCENLRYSTSGNALKIDEAKNNNTQILPIKNKDDYEEFRKNRELWRSFNFNDYRYVARAFEGGNVNYADPVLIEVEEKRPVAVTPVSKSDTRSIELYKKVDTVEKIFDLIEDAFENSAEIEIEYDKKYGFPKKFRIDDSQKGVHGWLTAEINKLENMLVSKRQE